jgi:hypothetical protein
VRARFEPVCATQGTAPGQAAAGSVDLFGLVVHLVSSFAIRRIRSARNQSPRRRLRNPKDASAVHQTARIATERYRAIMV